MVELFKAERETLYHAPNFQWECDTIARREAQTMSDSAADKLRGG